MNDEHSRNGPVRTQSALSDIREDHDDGGKEFRSSVLGTRVVIHRTNPRISNRQRRTMSAEGMGPLNMENPSSSSSSPPYWKVTPPVRVRSSLCGAKNETSPPTVVWVLQGREGQSATTSSSSSSSPPLGDGPMKKNDLPNCDILRTQLFAPETTENHHDQNVGVVRPTNGISRIDTPKIRICQKKEPMRPEEAEPMDTETDSFSIVPPSHWMLQPPVRVPSSTSGTNNESSSLPTYVWVRQSQAGVQPGATSSVLPPSSSTHDDGVTKNNLPTNNDPSPVPPAPPEPMEEDQKNEDDYEGGGSRCRVIRVTRTNISQMNTPRIRNSQKRKSINTEETSSMNTESHSSASPSTQWMMDPPVRVLSYTHETTTTPTTTTPDEGPSIQTLVEELPPRPGLVRQASSLPWDGAIKIDSPKRVAFLEQIIPSETAESQMDDDADDCTSVVLGAINVISRRDTQKHSNYQRNLLPKEGLSQINAEATAPSLSQGMPSPPVRVLSSPCDISEGSPTGVLEVDGNEGRGEVRTVVHRTLLRRKGLCPSNIHSVNDEKSYITVHGWGE